MSAASLKLVEPALPAASWLRVHPSLGVDLMTHLWNQLDSIFLGRWKSLFSGDGSVERWGSAWADAFVAEGVSPSDVKRGIAACRRKTDGWPPTLPEFLAMCRPRLDAQSAFIEAVEQIHRRNEGRDVWSHPAIYWAAVKIGAFDLRNATWAQIAGRWTAVFQKEMERGEWPEVPVRREALPAPGETMVTDDGARARLIALRAMLSGVVEKMDITNAEAA